MATTGHLQHMQDDVQHRMQLEFTVQQQQQQSTTMAATDSKFD